MGSYIIDYIRERFVNGPDFEDLVRNLKLRFEFNEETSTRLFAQLKVVFRESITEGISGVLYSESSSEESSSSHKSSSSSSSSEEVIIQKEIPVAKPKTPTPVPTPTPTPPPVPRNHVTQSCVF